jgi:hypothetical protein
MGNDSLKRAIQLTRVGCIPSAEVVSIGLFAKTFEQPIER